VPLWVSLAILTLIDSFFIIAFASFVEVQHDFSQTFSGWLKVSLSLFFWNASQVAYRYRVVGKDRDLQVGPRTLTQCSAHSHSFPRIFQSGPVSSPIIWHAPKHLLARQ
jgi:hypothetical protein